MNREMAFCVLPFSCWTFGEPLYLGTVERTDWTLIAHLDNVQLIRSDCSGRVKFDVVLVSYSSGKASREFKTTQYLNEGEAYLFFSSGVELPFYSGSGYQGIIKVYFNSEPTVDGRPSMFPNEPAVENRFTEPQVSNDLIHLLDNPDSFSDATIKCGNVNILVHKCILSAQSPVFDTMFKDQMQDGVLNITNTEPDVLQAMLRLVYSGKYDQLPESMVENLLFAAVKYQLVGLKSACINKLKSNIKLNNVIRYLLFGDALDTSLKDLAINFLSTCGQFSELEKTEDWKLLKKERPFLAIDVMTYVVTYMQDKWCRPAHLITMDQGGWYYGSSGASN